MKPVSVAWAGDSGVLDQFWRCCVNTAYNPIPKNTKKNQQNSVSGEDVTDLVPAATESVGLVASVFRAVVNFDSKSNGFGVETTPVRVESISRWLSEATPPVATIPTPSDPKPAMRFLPLGDQAVAGNPLWCGGLMLLRVPGGVVALNHRLMDCGPSGVNLAGHITQGF
jgi:hypothetical protein